MISLNQLRILIESGLNGLSSNEFKLFADVGEFKKSYKPDDSNTITRYINGIFESLSPTRLPIKNLQVVTQSFRITFVLDIELLEKDSDGQYVEVKEIRNLLEKYIVQTNGKPIYLTDAENISFEVTPTFSGISVGTATQITPIGNALPVYLDFSCVFVEGGTNTNSVNFIINGENMFFQAYSVTRTRTAESNMIANEKSSKTLAQANSISLNLQMPLLKTFQSKAIEADVWAGGQNDAVCVERIRYGENNAMLSYSAYIMIYGNNSETGNIGQNIGQTIDLVEGKPSELKYGNNWTISTFTAVSGAMTKTLTLPSPSGLKAVVIFWGDGTSTRVDMTADNPPASLPHKYSKAGTYTIRYFVY